MVLPELRRKGTTEEETPAKTEGAHHQQQLAVDAKLIAEQLAKSIVELVPRGYRNDAVKSSTFNSVHES